MLQLEPHTTRGTVVTTGRTDAARITGTVTQRDRDVLPLSGNF